jgi:hypothetical protein
MVLDISCWWVFDMALSGGAVAVIVAGNLMATEYCAKPRSAT